MPVPPSVRDPGPESAGAAWAWVPHLLPTQHSRRRRSRPGGGGTCLKFHKLNRSQQCHAGLD